MFIVTRKVETSLQVASSASASAASALAAAPTALFENEVLGGLLHLLRNRNKLNRLMVELDNAMVVRQHFISGWITIFSECAPLLSNLTGIGPLRSLNSDRIDKIEKDL